MNRINIIKELLDKYSLKEELTVVYRPNTRVDWGRNRKQYDGNCEYEYNHRSILSNEVVFDFDSDKREENIDSANKVIDLLLGFGIKYSVWDTGNKGYHIHTFWKMDGITDIPLLKKTILKYFAYGLKIDYQLAGKHLVRMEYGINEKKRDNYKTLVAENGDSFIEPNKIFPELFNEYQHELNKYLTRRIEKVEGIDNKDIEDLLNGVIPVEDGREKILFFLICKLRHRFTQQEMLERISAWYYYSGGTKISKEELRRKIAYHYNKNINYSFRPDFIQKIKETKIAT